MKTTTHRIFFAIVILLLAVCSVPVRASGSNTAEGGGATSAVTTNPDFSKYEKKFPWKPSEKLVNSLSSKRSTINYDEAKVRPYTLPGVFTLTSGEKVTTTAAWEQQRRGELLDLFRRHVYGFAPPKPETLTFRVIESDPKAMGGKATLKRVAIGFQLQGEPFTFHLTLFVPNQRQGKAPVFLLLNHRGPENTDPTRKTKLEFWPAEYVIERGYAVAAINVAAEVEPDNAKATTGIRAFYRQHYPKPDELTWGALSAWAWSGSRAVDYFETDPDIDPSKIAVIGHSRGGKTSLWAGAQDTRFALVCVNDAGEGGPALSRRNFGEDNAAINKSFPHWFAPKYATYAGKEDTLPVDHHEVVALVAPRGYHGADAADDLWADPRGSWLSLVEASKVWALYGKAAALQDPMPLVNDLLLQGPMAYHIRAGGHGLLLFDWKLHLDQADVLFKNSGSRGPSPATAATRPNIVYFLIDDLGYADVGFMGSKDTRTPTIDRLAGEGVILSSFYVQPVCSPTRSTLMTGRYVTRTGVYNVVRPGAPWGLPLAERTLPQALRAAGYTTAICGKWHLGEFQPEYMPTRRGFDHQYGHMFGALDYFTHIRDGKPDWYRDDQPLQEEGYTTHLIAKEACRLIRAQPTDKPLFLYVPFNGVHAPYEVPPQYKQAFPNLSGNRQTMAAMLAAVDEAIGQITAALEEKGLRKNTLIIFSSDNGGPGPGKVSRNTPLRAGKGTIYEGGIRACAFATWPGHIPAGKIIAEPMHMVDWYPTLLKLAGVSLEQKLTPDGLDVWPMLTQGVKSPHDAILLAGTVPSRMAIRMGDWKLLLNASEQIAEETPAGGDKVTGKVELYNLAEDIGESRNLAAAQPQRVEEMRTRLEAFLKDAVPPGQGSTEQKAPAQKTAGRKKGAKKQ
jgi:arylsulfatase A-like enzyme/dienelactone hydrolase